MYEIWNPERTMVLRTPCMGEADFWASLGYLVLDYFFLQPHKES